MNTITERSTWLILAVNVNWVADVCAGDQMGRGWGGGLTETERNVVGGNVVADCVM